MEIIEVERLKDLVDTFDNDESILNRLIELYPEQKKSVEGYRKVIHELRILKPKLNQMYIVLDYVKDEYGDYWDVSGRYKGKKTHYGIEFETWQKWLGMRLDENSMQLVPLLDFYCHCLWEMTWDGFDQEDIQGRLKELNDRKNEIIDKNK